MLQIRHALLKYSASGVNILGEQYLFKKFTSSMRTFVIKGMVHLIYKLYLKAVFLCVKFNGTIVFFWQMFVFNVKHVLNSKK